MVANYPTVFMPTDIEHGEKLPKLFFDDFVLGLVMHDRNFQGRYILRHP